MKVQFHSLILIPMKKHYFFLILLNFFFAEFAIAQDCESKVVMILNNISTGGYFSGQKVQLISFSTNKVFTETSNAKGEVTFQLPCDERFDVKISNYAAKDEIKSPVRANSMSRRTYSYEADMAEKRLAAAMNAGQKSIVDKAIGKLPDTTFVNGSAMRPPSDLDNYSKLDITLIDLKSQPLSDEQIIFTGRNRNKSFKAVTSPSGHVLVYLPKGDIYNINFQYHKNYRIEELEYSIGTTVVRIDIQYMGTKEYLRRKKAEEERMAQEKKRAAAAIARGSREYEEDKVLETVMDRNNWTNKLLISDVSSEMLDYAKKLANWYIKNRKPGETTQFVLYNNQQRHGSTKPGNAFHLENPDFDELNKLIDYVYANKGLEGAKHDLKGLIVGDGIAKNYKDVILYVDKDAALHDYEYFKQLKAPVHVVLCVDPRRPNAQHLTIAWKMKGSVHTLSGDFTNIGKLVEGDTFEIEGYKYKIMGGEFVLIS
jgi:hypothetical protein